MHQQVKLGLLLEPYATRGLLFEEPLVGLAIQLARTERRASPKIFTIIIA